MKKLIIVCEEKLRRYGDFLSQLLSGTDDRDGKIVGIKDGVAAAQVWTEKEYSSNAAQISSEQYLLFIGNSKMIKEKRYHMQKKYSEYGMNYGWLGKQAVMFVDRSLAFSEYEGFYKLATNEASEGNQPELARLLPAKQIPDSEQLPDVIVELTTPDSVPTGFEEENQEKKGIKKLLVPFGSAKVALKKTANKGKETLNKMSENINAASKSKDIEDQHYTCLVLLFYLNDLGSFLGVNEG